MIGKKINQLATELAPVSTDLTIIGDPDSGVSKKITLAQLGAIFSGAVSFYTNLASFPAVGDINVIYCAKDTQKLYLWSGSAYVEVFPSQALLNTYQLRSEKGVSNGYASLDSAGKVPISQLPSSIMEYKGTWNASTNTPTLANGTGDTGDVYICNVAGTVNFGAGPITFAVGDYVIYSGTIWQRSSGAVGTVTSVAASITGDAIGITGSPITTSGTLALAFAGTSAQYINGAGNLTTFPTSLVSGSGASGQVTFFNGANSVTGTNNFFWDATNNRLGIGTTTPQRSIEIYNTTADNHLRLSGNAPSVSMGEAVTGSVYQAKFGLVTTNGQFVSAGVAGDFVIISQTGATIIGTSSTEKMRVNTSGNVSINNTNNTYKLDVTGTGRYTGQLRLESTITDGTNTYTLPSATGTLALTSQLTGGTVTSVGLSSATSGVTIGSTPITTSGTITLAIATASGSQQGLLSSTDWTTFNNKQSALTNPVTGTGTTNYLPKFTGASTIGNSQVFDNGTNVGIGTATPSVRLHILGDAHPFIIASNSATTLYTTYKYNTTTDVGYIGNGVGAITGGAATDFGIAAATGNLLFATGGVTERMRLDASGNLGLGVSPSAWDTTLSKAIQLNGGSLWGYSTSQINLLQNGFYNTSGDIAYVNTASASAYRQISGVHSWHIAPSGTAGNAISFTQAMTLNASGNLSVGNTNDTYKLDVSGTGRFISNVTGGFVGIIIRNTSSGTNAAQLSLQTLTQDWLLNTRTDNHFSIYNVTAATTPFLLDKTTGAATFSSSVTASTGYYLKHSNGTTIAAIEQFSGTQGAGLSLFNSSGTQNVLFNAGGDSFIRGGNVGIGTTSPQDTSGFGRILDLDGASGSAYYSRYNGSSSVYCLFGQDASNSYLYTRTSPLIIYTNATERMRITSGGNVGIGTTSPARKLDVNGVTRSTAFDVYYNSVLTGFLLSENQWVGNSSTNLAIAAETGNAITFFTNGSASERMRITSGGLVLFGTTSAPSASVSGFCIEGSSSGNISSSGASTSAYNHLLFYNGNGLVGYISTSGSTTTYSTSSDYRLKQDYKDYSGLELVNKIKTYDYEWKSDKTRSYGVIAHELQSVINYAVTGVKDGKDMQGVDYSKIVPVLIKAIQELNDKIK
jgi:hypothetical protein